MSKLGKEHGCVPPTSITHQPTDLSEEKAIGPTAALSEMWNANPQLPYANNSLLRNGRTDLCNRKRKLKADKRMRKLGGDNFKLLCQNFELKSRYRRIKHKYMKLKKRLACTQEHEPAQKPEACNCASSKIG